MSQTNVLRSGAPLLLLCVAFLCGSIGITHAQENIMPQIPPSLAECYNTSYFMNRQNRLPATIETLISLIEKVENTPNYNHDMRTLAVALLQRFRQDGIQRAYGVAESPGVIPYSPTGFQFPKFRILLSRLIPGNAFTFPNSTLTREERCSLHFMLSSSLDLRVRGDEGQVCNRLSQYRAQRLRRSVNRERNGGMIGDVEMLESLNAKAQKQGFNKKGAYNAFDNDWGWTNTGNSNNNQISQCPVENGVIWTPWGTVSAGTLLAGVATGLQQQSVQLRTLLALSSRNNGYTNLPQTATVNVDNRWAATLAGDLAEVALVQVPFTSTDTASVGANGAWNSTVMPEWYFLTQRQNFEMTDAEIRGGLDGLIIAMNIVSWRNQASNMKLSQLLRMYYSTNGVLNSGIMACNRKSNFNQYASGTAMLGQTSAFAQVLDREMQLGVTLQPANIAQFSQSAVAALQNYVPNSLNDVTCSVSSSANGVSNAITPMTNIYVFLDTTWQYSNIVDYLNYILQRINVNPYASSVTLLAANDGSVIVNTTNYLFDVYQNWNVTLQSQFNTGFNLPNVLKAVQNLSQAYMIAEQTNSSVGGRSLIALMMPYSTVQVSASDSSYATTQLQYIYEQIPDLHFIYYTSGQINRFAPYVRDPSQDLFTLNTGNTASSSSAPVVSRINQIPRRLINPRCGSTWSTPSWGTDQLAQYLSPNGTNFYRMMPNYFFGAGSNRNVAIQSTSGVQFIICTSRTVPLPTQSNATNYNGASSDINCATIGNGFSYDLSNACNGYSYINQCPPLYLSVQAPATIQSTVSCNDNACQTPNQARYVVAVTNLGCYSGVAGLFASFVTVALAYFLREALQ
uniref:N-acetylmuramoyl-L-alanine amidase n=1 Tax=Zeugodacus cucurbitae TaxID=28588 RepID=A0A0A1XL35_ZEUCU